MESKKILILGASGFIGNALYKELCNYYDTYGTYFSSRNGYPANQQFIQVRYTGRRYLSNYWKTCVPLCHIGPKRRFRCTNTGTPAYLEYAAKHPCRLYFLSSANVFDAYSKFPSYEYDKTLSESIYGRLKIKIENTLLRRPKTKVAILRVPMVFGNTSPRIKEMKQAIWNNDPIEVFPNLIINVTNDDKLTQQVHYLINRNKSGIYHLGSTDLVHHEDFIREVVDRIGSFNPIYKRVFTTNEERFLAVLPKDNLLPKNLQLSYQDVIDHHVVG